MPAPCTLLLEVFRSAVEYDAGDEVLDWAVSTDPAHSFPYLLAPKNLDGQEIDPATCGAVIGTAQVGVIDPATVPGDQNTGWMTARVFDVTGRRCRLRLYVNEGVGWVTVADGPASAPQLDQSYSAYRWHIRDTREVERRLPAFNAGGTCGIVPRGPVHGFGSYEGEDGPTQLIPPLTGIPGRLTIQELGDGSGRMVGTVFFDQHFTFDPSLEPPDLHEPRLQIDEEGEAALGPTDMDGLRLAYRNADVLWRAEGSADPWNIARPTQPAAYIGPMAIVTRAFLDNVEVRAVQGVLVFFDDDIPAGFPIEEIDVEVILRHRGPPNSALPYYFEGTAGELLAALYDGRLSSAPELDGGALYDPAGLDAEAMMLAARIRYDAIALDAMVTPVLLRQTEPVEDARAWAESAVCGPSGWIPALDADLRISPVSRNRPTDMTGAPAIVSSAAQPNANWSAGERVVTAVEYTYKRFFVPPPSPAPVPSITTEPDGLAIREVPISFVDGAAEAMHGSHPESYEASAFSAVGAPDGTPRVGVPETGSLLAQEARFEVLARYRNGAQSFPVAVLRSTVPTLRVGDWVTWDLPWLPDRFTGLRAGEGEAAQVLALRDEDCVWRGVLLEESTVSTPPGFVSGLEKTEDEPSAGFASTLSLLSDEEGGS